MIDMRLRIMMFCIALLGLLVCIDGLLQGQWLRMLGGGAWAGAFGYLMVKGPGVLVPQRVKDEVAGQLAQAAMPTKSWPLVFAGVLFAVTCLLVAALFLFAPWEELIDLFSSRRHNWPGFMRDLGGEWFARLSLAGLCLFAAGAASWTVRARLRD